MVGPTAITVGLRPRYVTIFIVMDVAAGRRAVNKYVHSLDVAPLPRLRRLPCVLLSHINHWNAWKRCGKVVKALYSPVYPNHTLGPAQCVYDHSETLRSILALVGPGTFTFVRRFARACADGRAKLGRPRELTPGIILYKNVPQSTYTRARVLKSSASSK